MYIHFRVMDRDEISADDFLGEVKVPFKHITLNRTLYLELSSVTKRRRRNHGLRCHNSIPKASIETRNRIS